MIGPLVTLHLGDWLTLHLVGLLCGQSVSWHGCLQGSCHVMVEAGARRVSVYGHVKLQAAVPDGTQLSTTMAKYTLHSRPVCDNAQSP